MATDCIPLQLEFQAFGKVVGDFEGGRLSGGVALLREADRALDLTRRLAACRPQKPGACRAPGTGCPAAACIGLRGSQRPRRTSGRQPAGVGGGARRPDRGESGSAPRRPRSDSPPESRVTEPLDRYVCARCRTASKSPANVRLSFDKESAVRSPSRGSGP